MTPRILAASAALTLAAALRRVMERRDLRRQRREAHYG